MEILGLSLPPLFSGQTMAEAGYAVARTPGDSDFAAGTRLQVTMEILNNIIDSAVVAFQDIDIKGGRLWMAGPGDHDDSGLDYDLHQQLRILQDFS